MQGGKSETLFYMNGLLPLHCAINQVSFLNW